MQISELYQWEIETDDNQIIRQYDNDNNGIETPSTVIPCDKVVRVSILPRIINGYPRHDVLIDISKGEKFIKRFGRGFMKKISKRYELFEYIHCVEISHYRLWVFSSTGQSLVSNKDFDLYITQ